MSLDKATVAAGLAGMFLDLDHLTTPLLNGAQLKDVWSYMLLHGTRPLHIPGLWISFMVFLYVWCIYGEEENGGIENVR